jgi:RHS repeat-associated protein
VFTALFPQRLQKSVRSRQTVFERFKRDETMLTLRTTRIVRLLCMFICFTLLCLQIGPAYAAGYQAQVREAAARPKLHLPDILLRPQTKNAHLAKHPGAPAGPLICMLTNKQMSQIRGRGVLRDPYYSGSLPWQRSYHDVNTTNGNLFKSYTDMQVAQAQGPGLALQRTYNSNDATIGPFGTGWTHAYDIQMQESSDVAAQAGSKANEEINGVPRTDFFGGKHMYHRDADGLYSPPPYLYDEMSSAYGTSVVNGPTQVLSDTDIGEDGTIKHYTNEVTNANGISANDRMCDYIQDRHGNRTVLAYGQSIVQADGSTRNLLTSVTDPLGHSIVFTWSNVGTTSQPAWRITQVQGPLVNGKAVAGSTYVVEYDYYTNTSDSSSCYNLKDVRIDPTGLNRTTAYTYTSYTGSNSLGTSTETGLLSTITDPLGHVTTYSWGTSTPTSVSPDQVLLSLNDWQDVSDTPTMPTIYVYEEGEPGSNGVESTVFFFSIDDTGAPNCIAYAGTGTPNSADTLWWYPRFQVYSDDSQRVQTCYGTNDARQKEYDADNNVIADYGTEQSQIYTYGQQGNVLTQQFQGYSAQNVTAYYNASQYFQKQSDTDMDGHVTRYGVGTNTAGNSGDPDPNTGDRGEVLWERDAGYNDTTSPSYGKQYSYTYNQYGQKLTSTDLKGTVTQNVYGTADDTVDGYYDLGRIVQVIQDPGTGHLNRTTSMHYDASGRVIQSTDPMGHTTTYTYNILGQPMSVEAPANGSVLAEMISYTYEADGRTHSVTDNRGTTVITYEDEHYDDYTDYGGRVYSVSDPVTGTISYSYLVTGERATETLPSGHVWTYNYYLMSFVVGSGHYIILPKDDLNSAVQELIGITDEQGRAVNVVENGFGMLGSVMFNCVFNDEGSPVAADETQDTYDNVYHPTFSGGGIPANGRGYLTQRSTVAMQVPASSGGLIAETLCTNAYTYDNAGSRLTNSVSVAVTGTNGAVQYSGGSTTYGAAQINPDYSPDIYMSPPMFYSSGDESFDFSYAPVTNVAYTSRTESYGYDDLNRLTAVNYGDTESQSYSFDAMGNRLGKTDTVTPSSGSPVTSTSAYSYDAANRLTAVSQNGGSAAPVTFDADGNTLSDSSGRTYTWDSQNRMVSCTYQGQTTTFTYGADGLRRSMTVNGITTYYAYDGTMLVQEFQTNAQTGQAAVTATYMLGPSGPICRINETEQTEGYYLPGVTAKAPLARGVTHWYVYDGLGSVIAELDDNNNMTTSGQYDVYGAPRAGTRQGGSPTSSQGYVGSLGHVTDAGTGGLIYMQARYYDPGLGRFVSEDPGRNGVNWYVYSDGNPVNNVDATGKDSEGEELEAMSDSSFMEGASLDDAIFYRSSNSLKGALQDLLGVDDDEAGAIIHLAKKYQGLGAADNIGVDSAGGLWTSTGEFIGFAEDFM